jgi:dihydroneopterin aldolase
MDKVFIRGLEARTIIGLEDWERKALQTVRIDVDLGCDISAAAETEDVSKTVNYRSVAKAILSHVEESEYLLVETMAERIAKIVLDSFDISWVRLRISKPGAVRFSDEVGVDIRRERATG